MIGGRLQIFSIWPNIFTSSNVSRVVSLTSVNWRFFVYILDSKCLTEVWGIQTVAWYLMGSVGRKRQNMSTMNDFIAPAFKNLDILWSPKSLTQSIRLNHDTTLQVNYIKSKGLPKLLLQRWKSDAEVGNGFVGPIGHEVWVPSDPSGTRSVVNHGVACADTECSDGSNGHSEEFGVGHSSASPQLCIAKGSREKGRTMWWGSLPPLTPTSGDMS